MPLVRRKFGDTVRDKSDTAQVSEVLCRMLCHNICMVIQSMHELGIEPVFGTALAPMRQAV